MGETMSIPTVLGPKSIKNHKVKDIDYLDPKHSRTTKNELYQLYSQGKLIHTEKYHELEDQLNKLLDLSKDYIRQIIEYKEDIASLQKKNKDLEYKCNNARKSENDKHHNEDRIDKELFTSKDDLP